MPPINSEIFPVKKIAIKIKIDYVINNNYEAVELTVFLSRLSLENLKNADSMLNVLRIIIKTAYAYISEIIPYC